jgi:hypothetical protein
MTLSLWGQIGALIGALLGYINFRVIIGILEPRLRKLDGSKTAEERAAFERKLVLLRRIFFTFEIVVLGAVGYFVGSLFGG